MQKMSKKSIVSAAERGDLSELQHVLENSEWDIESEPLDTEGQTALHIACANGHLDIVQYLVNKKGCSVTVEDIHGHTPLMYSFTNKQWKMANFLLQIVPHSAIIKLERLLTNFSESFMMKVAKEAFDTSCKSGCFELVRYLTKIGWHIGDYKETIQLARESNNLHIVKYLLNHCQCTMPDDMSEVHIACVQGDVKTMKTALENYGSSILGTTDSFGTKAIHYATLEPDLLRMIVQCAGGMLLNVTDSMGNTPLHHSVNYECIESITILVEAPGCDVNIANLKRETPLIVACKHCNNDVIHLLLKCERFDLTTSDSDENTALHITVSSDSSGQLENVQCMLQSGRCDPNVINISGNAPLHIVCHRDDIPLLEALVADKRCDLNVQDGNGDTALHIGVKNVEIVKCLVESGRSRCDIYNKKGLTPFHKAIANGVMASVEMMLKNGVDILRTTNDKIQSAPIHIACIYSQLDILKVLLSYTNCDPNQQNAIGNTALHIVCRMRNVNELQFLEVLTSTPGINPTLVNHDGITPFEVVENSGSTILHIACAEGNSTMVEYLVRNGADVLKPDRSGHAPIHIACKHRRLDTLKVLLGFKPCGSNQQSASGDTALAGGLKFLKVQCLLQSDPNVINKSGSTPLHIVCHLGDIPLIEALVADKRCDLNVQDGNGDTALHIGVENVEIVKCLVESGRSRFDTYNDKGLTPFHKAIANGIMASVEVMLKNGVDILQASNDELQSAPIHIACINSQLDILKVLLSYTNCDPNQQNAVGDTALHIVCGMRTGRELQFLEVLASTPQLNYTLLNHEGDAPIHVACECSRLGILKVLLGCEMCDVNQQNVVGNTALHIVCGMRTDSILLEPLLCTPGINPEIANHIGCTPIEVDGANYSAINAIQEFLENKKSSIQAYLKIFVVGNSGNGKSTLIKAVTTEASQLRKYALLSKMKYVNPSDVPLHTAGIVPIPFNSKHFGNAVLYDFAGQHEYYSSHAAVMENLILPSPPLFLLLIDISKSKKVIREELVYWWHFINNQSQKAAAPPHVILAGSHKDMVKSEDREKLEMMINDCIKRLPVTFKFVGYYPLDCRKLVSRGLSALLTQLTTTCQTLRGIVNVNLHCHILNALLNAPEFQGLVYCQLFRIVNQIEADNTLLPKVSSQLIPLLESLNDQGYILLLHNHTDESKSWVILKPDVLLTEVNGSVFAPKYFKEHSEFAMSTGVVTLSKLKEKFTEYNHEVIVAYLTHLEFCFRIKDQHTLDMITNNQVHESANTEDYYFFPALVSVENPTDVCLPHQSIGYECGWLYKCSKETEQLTSRFLHVLILRLAFACEPPDDPNVESVVLLRSCSVWKHGIAWWTNDGIEVIVEVGLQCQWVAVMMRCPATERIPCTELRSNVISTVLKTKTKFCPTITIKEYLIAPSSLKYPFEGRELTLYSMREVAKATIEGKKYVKDTEGKNPITIPQLLPFEPYHNMGDLVPKFFSGDTSAAVPPEELTQLAEKCHNKLAELNTAFKPNISSFQRDCEKADYTEVERCVALFHILQRGGRFKTWRDFQQEFSRFSVFCDQSHLEKAGRFSESETPLTISPSAKDDIQRGMDTPLGDDTHESYDSVRVSEDVPRSLPIPVPKSPTQSHTSTDSTSEIGPTRERFTGLEKMSRSQPATKTHMPSNATDQTVTEQEESICNSAANIASGDSSHDDIQDQLMAENAGLKPSMKDLTNQVIPTVCPMWRDIGLQLNLDISILNEIRANCRGDVRECCTIMFEKWLNQDTKASWCTVLSACRRVKENLASGPDEAPTKDHIKALTLLISVLPDFLANL